ncbi:metallophosphoesterase [Pradoshia sp.]
MMWVFLIAVMLALVFAALLAYMYKLAKNDSLNEVVLTFEDFPSSDRISLFFISDVHRRIIGDTLVDAASGKVDFVLISGDLTEKGVPIERVRENLQKLKGLGPVYFIWGNNDYESDVRELDALFVELGVKVLADEGVIFETSDGGIINLLGIDYYEPEERSDGLMRVMEESIEGTFKILASHTPSIDVELRREDEIRLVLSGHTHGGQIRLFGLGPYRLGGIHYAGDTVVFTSNGYGTSGLPLRLGAKPEVHIIHLSRAPIE